MEKMKATQLLHDKGQSLWLDNITRNLLDSGTLHRYIDELSITGLTSNPTIFDHAIKNSSDYDAAIAEGIRRGKSDEALFFDLALDDLTRAADLFRPIHEKTNGVDGWVSLEVSPLLAHDATQTVAAAKELFARANRANLFIKIPATPEGIPAIQATLARGINVNVTLIFSLSQYDAVIQAFMAGVEQYAECGGDVKKLASVASFFVSRVDGLADKKLQTIIDQAPNSPRAEQAHQLLGKIAIANAKLAYALFTEQFSGPRWDALSARGARVQRPLWASTCMAACCRGASSPSFSPRSRSA